MPFFAPPPKMPPSGVRKLAPIFEAVFVPVFWWCSEAVGRTRGGCLASLGILRPEEPVGHHHQLNQPPPVVLGPLPLNIILNYLPPGRAQISSFIPVRSLHTLGEDRLRRCFLHAASYNVIITASIPGEGGGSIWSQSWNGGSNGSCRRQN